MDAAGWDWRLASQRFGKLLEILKPTQIVMTFLQAYRRISNSSSRQKVNLLYLNSIINSAKTLNKMRFWPSGTDTVLSWMAITEGKKDSLDKN